MFARHPGTTRAPPSGVLLLQIDLAFVALSLAHHPNVYVGDGRSRRENTVRRPGVAISTPLELWLALVEECCDPFPIVSAAPSLLLKVGLKVKLSVEGIHGGGLNRALRQP